MKYLLAVYEVYHFLFSAKHFVRSHAGRYVVILPVTCSDTCLFLDEFIFHLCQFNKSFVLDVNMNIAYMKVKEL